MAFDDKEGKERRDKPLLQTIIDKNYKDSLKNNDEDMYVDIPTMIDRMGNIVLGIKSLFDQYASENDENNDGNNGNSNENNNDNIKETGVITRKNATSMLLDLGLRGSVIHSFNHSSFSFIPPERKQGNNKNDKNSNKNIYKDYNKSSSKNFNEEYFEKPYTSLDFPAFLSLYGHQCGLMRKSRHESSDGNRELEEDQSGEF